MNSLTSVVAHAVGATILAVVIASFLWRGPRASATPAILFCGVLVVVLIALSYLPVSLSEFSLRSQRMGVESQLIEFRKDNPGCLGAGGACDPKALARVRGRGCTALQGERDQSWTYGCDLPNELVEQTRFGGIAISIFSRSDEDADLWLVTKDGVFKVRLVDAAK